MFMRNVILLLLVVVALLSGTPAVARGGQSADD
jgi:hypothetical protein